MEERVDSSSNPDRQFVWGLRYIDDMCIARPRHERLYALQDGNWNVTAVCDENGDVQEWYAYSAYGEPLFLSPGFVEQSGSSFGWEALFTGQRWDSPMRVFYVRHRYYVALIGVWISRDHVQGLSLIHLYTYCRARPTECIEPLGLEEILFEDVRKACKGVSRKHFRQVLRREFDSFVKKRMKGRSLRSIGKDAAKELALEFIVERFPAREAIRKAEEYRELVDKFRTVLSKNPSPFAVVSILFDVVWGVARALGRIIDWATSGEPKIVGLERYGPRQVRILTKRGRFSESVIVDAASEIVVQVWKPPGTYENVRTKVTYGQWVDQLTLLKRLCEEAKERECAEKRRARSKTTQRRGSLWGLWDWLWSEMRR